MDWIYVDEGTLPKLLPEKCFKDQERVRTGHWTWNWSGLRRKTCTA